MPTIAPSVPDALAPIDQPAPIDRSRQEQRNQDQQHQQPGSIRFNIPLGLTSSNSRPQSSSKVVSDLGLRLARELEKQALGLGQGQDTVDLYTTKFVDPDFACFACWTDNRPCLLRIRFQDQGNIPPERGEDDDEDPEKQDQEQPDPEDDEDGDIDEGEQFEGGMITGCKSPSCARCQISQRACSRSGWGNSIKIASVIENLQPVPGSMGKVFAVWQGPNLTQNASTSSSVSGAGASVTIPGKKDKGRRSILVNKQGERMYIDRAAQAKAEEETKTKRRDNAKKRRLGGKSATTLATTAATTTTTSTDNDMTKSATTLTDGQPGITPLGPTGIAAGPSGSGSGMGSGLVHDPDGDVPMAEEQDSFLNNLLASMNGDGVDMQWPEQWQQNGDGQGGMMMEVDMTIANALAELDEATNQHGQEIVEDEIITEYHDDVRQAGEKAIEAINRMQLNSIHSENDMPILPCLPDDKVDDDVGGWEKVIFGPNIGSRRLSRGKGNTIWHGGWV